MNRPQEFGALSDERRKLLERLLKKEGVDPAGLPIARRGVNQRSLASYAQQRLLLTEQVIESPSVYNINVLARFGGPLDANILRRCFEEIVRRHEALRTRLVVEGRLGVQVIDVPGPFHLEQIDVSGLGESTRETEIRRLALEEASHPFDLSRGPLFRARLIRVGAEDHVVLATMHHIVSDGWSIGVLIREVAALYEAFSRGEIGRAHV